MSVKLLNIDTDSPADLAKMRSGDRILSFNGKLVEDALDLQFLLGERTEVLLERDGNQINLSLNLPDGSEPGWEIEPLELRTCKCNCVFCFVDQQPPNLRSTLYIKDEDYRFSFLFGNYLTLVGISGREFERIIRMKLSPLYVSIHTVDPVVRGKLLGLKSAPVLSKLRKLIDGGIEIHGQIVLVPGYNDGKVLEDSLNELLPLYPGLASLSVVPIGLTKHRKGLNRLRPLSVDEAEITVDIVRSYQKKAMETCGSRWVFPSDELLIKAGLEIPQDDYYEEYPQIENGVGIARWTYEQVEQALEEGLNQSVINGRILWVTGHSAASFLQQIASDISERFIEINIEVLPVQNRLLGSQVTVAGLLCGKDILDSLKDYFRTYSQRNFDKIYLPPDCINYDGLLLDNYSPEEISAELDHLVEAFDGDWVSMITGQSGSNR
ncbi:hypothetical protein CEE37_04325 [candidate division LCP-89 bacterium B3_LCP]|uniref:PDZ domain-containing protein n=1 Tax=candidate division LCP-89 bacterium B3_LCP TaxID=2012998 RepID=A0A532V3K7_UNCL8|nr:MAG: hypothetical protein CEE37_04325 [candidate division LCP-89 bacterium B3_LCP]